ncbi:MAG: transcription elongation factor GreA [Clostridia bacterium]|nr:transcription elongation factor GreA [Clostridia bacterium]
MAKLFKLTREKFEELQNELEYLKTVREKEVAELIKEARSFGDLSENSEYDEAKNEQGKLYSRIGELESILANYEIIDESMDVSIVRTGSRVLVKDTADGSEDEYYIVGSTEADPMENRISDESPFGKAVLGKTIGDLATVDAPAGQIVYEILDIAL